MAVSGIAPGAASTTSTPLVAPFTTRFCAGRAILLTRCSPDLADNWTFSDDGKALTLHFREGLKWSDGVPFTVDDVIFWWEAIETDTNVTAAIHGEWMVGGEPMTLEKVDDSTITLHFAAPNGLAETVGLAFHGNSWPLGFERFGFYAPKHYLEQFHPAYSADRQLRPV